MTVAPTIEMLERSRLSRLPTGLLGAPLSAPVDTYGWDSVFTLRLPQVNKAIAASGVSPKSFETSIDDRYTVSATFDPWRIGHTGDGTLINLHIGLNGISTIDHNGTSKSLPDSVAVVQVKLEFVPHTPMLRAGLLADPQEEEEAVFSLKVATSKPEPMLLGGPLGGVEDRKAATLIALAPKAAGEKLGTMDRVIIEAALDQWLNANLDSFGHVFAEVSLASTPKDGAFAWLKPRYASYAFLGGESEEESELAILTLTEPERRRGLFEAISPGAAPGDEEEGTLVLSRSKLLDKMMKPALPKAFKGLREKDVVLNPAGDALELQRSTQLHDVKHQGKAYNALLRSLRIGIKGDEISVHSFTETEASPGIFSLCDAIARYKIRLLKSKGGEQTLTYTEEGEPSVYESTRQSKTVDLVKKIILVIGILVGIIVSVLTAGASVLVACLVAALVAGGFALLAQIPNIIAWVNEGKAPSIDLLATSAAAPIKWTGETRFKPVSAQMNDSLVIGGVFV